MIKEMIKTIILFLLAFSLSAQAKDIIKVAVIDTGLDLKDPRFSTSLCQSGHKNLTSGLMIDDHRHGTHVAGLIKSYAKDASYCMIIYKIFTKSEGSLDNEVLAIRYAIQEHVQYVNISGGGPTRSKEEYDLIASNPQITFIVAAGNAHQDLDDPKTRYYPAQYHLSNVKVVGNLTKTEQISPSSNYGKGLYWEIGEDVLSTCPLNIYCTMSGSSMSTAIHTGKLIYSNFHRKKEVSKRKK